jgi:hypothetical protein
LGHHENAGVFHAKCVLGGVVAKDGYKESALVGWVLQTLRLCEFVEDADALEQNLLYSISVFCAGCTLLASPVSLDADVEAGFPVFGAREVSLSRKLVVEGPGLPKDDSPGEYPSQGIQAVLDAETSDGKPVSDQGMVRGASELYENAGSFFGSATARPLPGGLGLRVQLGEDRGLDLAAKHQPRATGAPGPANHPAALPAHRGETLRSNPSPIVVAHVISNVGCINRKCV